MELSLAGRIIGTTAEHPFYAYDRGWVNAKELTEGDRVLTENGQWLRVDGLEDSGRVETVYNVEVEEDHTYFVGEADWGWAVWAHNASCTITANKAQGAAAEKLILSKLQANKHVTVLGTQIRIRTPGNPRFRITDILVRNNRTGIEFIVEVKSGGAIVNASQAGKDALIATGGSVAGPTVFYGRAPGALAGRPTGALRTFIARVK